MVQVNCCNVGKIWIYKKQLFRQGMRLTDDLVRTRAVLYEVYSVCTVSRGLGCSCDGAACARSEYLFFIRSRSLV
jgi:hypothetical protein